MFTEICPECSGVLYTRRINVNNEKCHICNECENILRCTSINCNYNGIICEKCFILPKKTKPTPEQSTKKTTLLKILFPIIVAVIAVILYLLKSSQVQDHQNVNLLGRLRKQFPSQKNETWFHILSVLEQKVPTVKAITLLHSNDWKTSDCLAKELVNIFSGDVQLEEVTFDIDKVKYTDYGEVLNYYHMVVKRFRVLVTNLNVVPASIARVFHSLCDEVSSDIKPSLFIFTLKWDDQVRNSKMIERASAILKKSWRELPDSEIFPLLSRVVKNVVDVIPEKQEVC